MAKTPFKACLNCKRLKFMMDGETKIYYCAILIEFKTKCKNKVIINNVSGSTTRTTGR